jgi:hypothetical protein
LERPGTIFGLTRTALIDARGCRRDIRSNGWIELLPEADPAEETSFLRSVRTA